MSELPKAGRYETSAPQWVDFEAMTPNTCPDDGYFDRFHHDLESTPYLRQMQSITPDSMKKADRLQKVKASSLFSNVNDSVVESNFINDLNEMYISPIKLTSPRSKNQETQVLQELSVDEVLNDALKGMEIASSITKKHRTPKLNKTAYESTTTTPKQRQIRVSRSMNFNSIDKQTPVAYTQTEGLKSIPNDVPGDKINQDKDGVSGNNKGIQSVHINEEQKENINIKIPKIRVEHIKTPVKNVITSHHRTPSGRTAIKITTTPCRMSLQNAITPRKYAETEDIDGINEQDNTMIAEEDEDDDGLAEIIECQESKSPGEKSEPKKLSSDRNMTISTDDNYRSIEKRKLRISKSLHHPAPSVFSAPQKKNITTPCTVKLERLLTPLKNIKINNIHLFDGGVKDTMDIDDDLQAEIESAGQVLVKSEAITPAAVHTEARVTEVQSQCSEYIENHKEDGVQNLSLDNASPSKCSSGTTEASTSNSIGEMQDDVFEPLEDFRKKLDSDQNQIFKVHYNRPGKRQSTQAKPKVLTGTARRRSDQHQSLKPNAKYVSLAEGVSTFHRNTPTRFHTVSSKVVEAKAGPVQKIKQAPKRTIPVSPAWHGRTRTRRPMLTQFEQEQMAREKNKIRANPIPKGILNAPKPLKAVPKKPPTQPKPFELTGTRAVVTKKPKNTSKPATETRKTAPITSSSTSSTTSASTSTANVPLTRSNSQIKRRTVLTISNDGVAEQQQVLHFGIPVVTKKHQNVVGTRRTVPQPFSLEARNQEFLMKKQRKLEKLREEEAKKLKSEFHARPVPGAVKKSVKREAKTEKVKKAPAPIKVMPFSFEYRDKMLAKKKEEKCKKAAEEAQKVRVFHANPAPTFKPVTVRTTSKECIRSESRGCVEGKPRTVERTVSVDRMKRGNSNDKLKNGLGTRGLSAQNLRSRQDSFTSSNFVRKPIATPTSSSKDGFHPDQESTLSNAPSASTMPAMKKSLTTMPELHSDRRAKMRQGFDEKLKSKVERDNALQRMEKQAKIIKEQAEINEIRRKAEVKARPMPVYKSLVIAKSDKPLTEPSSPAWIHSKQ